ncbi:MAG: four helix bundle protein [Clostridia bacterium]|nr:four helix bundle protein [Clostridia bacterium]
MKENIIIDKTRAFSKRIVYLGKYLTEEKREFILSKQIVRSGTSIGANVFEAQNGQSKSDFASKMNIALKEATETVYWLIVLHDTEYITDKEYDSLYSDVNEIRNILISICKTSYNNL